MLDILVVCLHGFLGQAEDWEKLKKQIILGRQDLKVDFYCPNFFETLHPLSPLYTSYDDFPIRLAEELKRYQYKKIVIVGYSMGGRLALQTVVKEPQLFDKAIFISTNPGLLSLKEKENRSKSDHIWAERFLNDDWGSLLRDWNQQLVFSGGRGSPVREEKFFCRESLSMAMKKWSVSESELGWYDLRKIKIPNVWIVGEKDEKYMQILKVLKERGVGTEFQVVANSGHRIHCFSNNLFFDGLL